MIFLLCAVALGAIAQAKPVGTPKLSIHKNNIKVWTYQNEQNPVFLSIKLKPPIPHPLKMPCP